MNPVLLLIPTLLPIVCGGILLVKSIGGSDKRNCFTMTVACVTSVLTLLLLFFARRESVTVYSFISGFSVGFRVDGMAALFAGMLALLWPPALLYAYEYMERDHAQNVFFAFYLMTYGVALGVAFSVNLVTLYVFYEMLTLITLPLVTHLQNEDSLHAGRQYMVYCVAGAAMAFIAVVIGTLDGSGDFLYGGNLAGEYAPELMRAIFLFGFFGFGAKAALFPLHAWLPTASVAPTPVTALLHAVAVVNAGFFAVTRLAWYAYGPALLAGSWEQTVCVLAAAFSMVFAAAMALRQRHFKRRLAYSTMSNLSYMLFGVALLTPEGMLGGVAHMLFHSVIKMSLFLCAGAFMHVTGKEYLYELNGVGRRMPVTFTCYTLGALSLTGIPLFCGFVSKWKLLTAALAADTVASRIGAGALLAAAFLCAIYTLTVSIRAFFPQEGSGGFGAETHDPGWRMLLPICAFTVLNILFGVCSAPVMAFLLKIAEGVL